MDRELAGPDPETACERMISLHLACRVPEFALAATLCPGTMRMRQPGVTRPLALLAAYGDRLRTSLGPAHAFPGAGTR